MRKSFHYNRLLSLLSLPFSLSLTLFFPEYPQIKFSQGVYEEFHKEMLNRYAMLNLTFFRPTLPF